jgi:large subunit ribosomal protein L31e
MTESHKKADKEEVTEEETEAGEGEEVPEEEIETVDEKKVEEKIEEEKPVEKKKVEIEEERVYTIPLKRAWISKRPIRSPKAMKIIKSFVTRHMKSEEIKIDNSLNSIIWARGIEKPPRKVRVRVTRDKEGIVNVYPLEEALTKQTKG